MSDQHGSAFPGFAGFQPTEMFEKMWEMMRLAPFFGGAPGMGGAGGVMGMPSPPTSLDELDKRIADLRAVEQWLKLNLGMLQSAIQALEVQRATLATLQSFGAFGHPMGTMPDAMQGWPFAAGMGAAAAGTGARAGDGFAAAGTGAQASDAAVGASTGEKHAQANDAPRADEDAAASSAAQAAAAGFDPSSWWNLLQSQFNQLASFAINPPGAMPGARDAGAAAATSADAANPGAAHAEASARKPAAKRAAPKSTASASKTASTGKPAANKTGKRPA